MAPVDEGIWYGFAGTTPDRIPPPGSFVYYFSEGHAKQSQAVLPEKPYFLCKVISATLGYENDYPLVTFLLIPVEEAAAAAVAADEPPEKKKFEVVSFQMVLKPSDLGNIFQVPDECAELIFSTFDNEKLLLYGWDQRTWKVSYTKVNRSHYFMTGWKEFAEMKGLEEGDTIAFVKKVRTPRPNVHVGVRKPRPDGFGNEEHVLAIQKATGGRRFRVRYFPLAAPIPFVVPATLVSPFSEFDWSRGIVKWFNVPSDEARVTDLLDLELGVAGGSSSIKRGADEPEGDPASKRGRQDGIVRLFGVDIHKGGDDKQDG